MDRESCMDLECQLNDLNIVCPIFKVKGNIWNCSCFGVMRLLQYGMKVVERIIHKIKWKESFILISDESL